MEYKLFSHIINRLILQRKKSEDIHKLGINLSSIEEPLLGTIDILLSMIYKEEGYDIIYSVVQGEENIPMKTLYKRVEEIRKSDEYSPYQWKETKSKNSEEIFHIMKGFIN